MKSGTIIFIYLFLISMYSGAQTSYQFQGREIAAGTKAHFLIPIVTGHDSTFIPVTVFNGIRKGKTLGITAGIHGYEYAPIIAAQKLIGTINPRELSGVVIIVQLAGLESFLGRSPYKSPVDGKNLNRTFPGRKDGSNTEKAAHFISEQIISRSDFFCDMHSGDAPEDLMSYGAYYRNSSMKTTSDISKAMAVSLGFDHVVVFNTDGKDYMKKDQASLYCTAEAFKRGIPSIDIECGRLGILEQNKVDMVEDAILRLLTHLNFLTGHDKVVLKSPNVISDRIYTPSSFTGIFYPLRKAGDDVKKGAKLGYLTNYFGEIMQTIYAETDGILLLILGTPPVNKGEDLAVIGKLQRSGSY